MDFVRVFSKETFASLSVRNYRLYLIGRGISLCGDWMQTVAMGWLVLQLTGSGGQLGVILACLYAPLLFGAPFSGLIVDRFDKRRLLYATQFLYATIALILSFLVFTGLVEMWMLYILAITQGFVNLIDHPTRQTFVHDLVGREYLRNAVTLNSTEANLARAIGPLFAGAIIAAVGIAACFLINAISFAAVVAILLLMRYEPAQKIPHEGGEEDIWSGLRYVASQPLILTVLIVMGFIGTFSYEFQVSLPILAQKTFLGNAADYAALLSAMGAGSVAGGLFAASREGTSAKEFALSAICFGSAMVVTALMPTLGFAIVGMIFVGFFSINLTSVGNTMIQLESAPHMRGRVMSLWSSAIFGSTLIGGPAIGFIGQYFGARAAIALGGVTAIFSGMYAARRLLDNNTWHVIPSFVRFWSEDTASEDPKV